MKALIIKVTNEVLDDSADPISGDYTDTVAIKKALKQRGVTMSSSRIAQQLRHAPGLSVYMSPVDEHRRKIGSTIHGDALYYVERRD